MAHLGSTIPIFYLEVYDCIEVVCVQLHLNARVSIGEKVSDENFFKISKNF